MPAVILFVPLCQGEFLSTPPVGGGDFNDFRETGRSVNLRRAFNLILFGKLKVLPFKPISLGWTLS